ncbi:MAG: 3-deoxy-manno-octulosonate cytidylyltransferase [Phycisphaerae bacterium]
MTCIAVIPARYGASRFPGKPLARKTGKYLIQHVYEQVASCALIDHVVVATDDDRIANAVTEFGGRCAMTRADHTSGTDRIAEAAESIGLAENDLVLNIQGDEPEIEPASIEGMITSFRELEARQQADGVVVTLATPFPETASSHGNGSPEDPNCVKVVVRQDGFALYFSRSPIPFPRHSGGVIGEVGAYKLHVGAYGFSMRTLAAIAAQPRGNWLETHEGLEQLRWMDHGMRLLVRSIPRAAPGIDTPAEYEAFVRRYEGTLD